MERIELTRQPANAPPNRPSNLPENSRLRAVTALIQQSRVLSGLTPLQESEMAIYLPTWIQTLTGIPNELLKAAFDRACETHEWPKPFPVPAIVKAYDQLIIEDRDRIKRERFSQSRRNPDTYACRYCLDLGYALIDVWCAGTGTWRRGRIACECELTPMMQRRPSPVTSEWKFDRDSTAWIPPDAQSAPTCTCLFCKNRR